MNRNVDHTLNPLNTPSRSRSLCFTTTKSISLDYTSRTCSLEPGVWQVQMDEVMEDCDYEDNMTGHRIVVWCHSGEYRQVAYVCETSFDNGHTTADAILIFNEIVCKLATATAAYEVQA